MALTTRPQRSAAAANPHTGKKKANGAGKSAAASASALSGESDLSDVPSEEDDASEGLSEADANLETDEEISEEERDLDDTGDFNSPGKKRKSTGAKRRQQPKAKRIAKAKTKTGAFGVGRNGATAGQAKGRAAAAGPKASRRVASTGVRKTVSNKEELNIKEDNALFNSVKDPDTALQSTAEDWVVTYQVNAGTALSQLVTFFFRCCGCNNEADEHVAQDIDAIVDNLDEIQEAFKKELLPSYPLVSKAASYKKFRKSLAEFLDRLFQTAAEAEVLYDEVLIETFIAWVSAMSSSSVRAFRHTATDLALWAIGSLAKVSAELAKERASAIKARDAERRKARGDKSRLTEFEANVKGISGRKKRVDDALEELMTSVYVHRYRDSDPNIRTDCVSELSAWMKVQPEQFMQSSYFRYLGWVLPDTHPDVRIAAIKGISGLYGRGNIPESVRHFTDLFKGRLVEMATGDVDLNVRVATIGVLVTIDKRGLLEDEQRDSLASHIFDVEPKIRIAVAGFVAGMLDALVEGRESQLGPEPSSEQTQAFEVYEGELSKLRFKCFAELLVRFAGPLDAAVATQSESQSSAQSGEQAEELSWSLGGLAEGRVGLAVNALWSSVQAVQQWAPLVELLLLDHSATSGDSRTTRPAAKKGRGRAAVTAESDAASRQSLYILASEEEAVLLEALVAILSKTKEQASAAKESGHAKSKAAQGADAADDDDEDDPIKALAKMTRDLIPALPKLFSKYRTDAPRIADILLLPQYIDLDLYDDDKGQLTRALDVVLGLAARGRLGYAQEAALVESALGVLALYIMWKTHAVIQASAEGEETQSALIGPLVDKRTTLLELMRGYIARDHPNIAVGVQQEALRHLLDIHIMHGNLAAADDAAVAAAQDAAGGFSTTAARPKMPASLRLECSSELQEKCGEYVRSELERYADELRSETTRHSNGGAEDEGKDAGSESDALTDVEDEGHADARRNKKKGKKAKTINGEQAGSGEGSSSRPTQKFLQRQHQLCQTLSHFIAAIRLGVLASRHAAPVLAFYGRLGHIFDASFKYLVEALKEEAIYVHSPSSACHVVLSSLKQSFVLFEQDPTSESENAFVNLARSLSGALVVRGAHLAVLKSVPSHALVQLHTEGCEHVISKALRAEQAGNQALKARAIIFWKGLAQLLPSATGRDAIRIKAAMDKLLADADIEVPPSAKAWEPQRSYEKRLVNIASRSAQLAKRAQAAKQASARKPAHESDNDMLLGDADEGAEAGEQQDAADADLDGLGHQAQGRPRPQAKRRREEDLIDEAEEEDAGDQEADLSPPPLEDSEVGLLDITADEVSNAEAARKRQKK
ncbi:Sister chromatid cohesion complex Cohesin, subunit STAG/IRR1/SCC3 [Ceraceosorus bombacis]|uniref:Sister chromatid cohesion complex Cohesin, subunit STAG/IRR1/SCC3 n=1 Tax=Ceraceosorus bombacis TaxID=401625 RepID=A0A0P1BEF8_9BASI|nr:Sister chromatid cohesion complex Cohesin, subunit STAG/IRR1/SCC3 [Ceraceosorus bombacis]